MSFYNMMNGVNKAAVLFILPMLGKHPDEYPRFRDCFLKDQEHPEYDYYIHVYTRVGGGNRSCGFGEEELYKHPNYISTFDDSFDNTYATYVFSVPEQWKEDFEKAKNGKIAELSEEYKTVVRDMYPKLKELLDKIWPADKEVKDESDERYDIKDLL